MAKLFFRDVVAVYVPPTLLSYEPRQLRDKNILEHFCHLGHLDGEHLCISVNVKCFFIIQPRYLISDNMPFFFLFRISFITFE